MTNLLSDDDNCNNNPGLRDLDGDSPLPEEGEACLHSILKKFQNRRISVSWQIQTKYFIVNFFFYFIGGLIYYSMYQSQLINYRAYGKQC